MNKTKKIAFAAVSLVMAGTMTLGVAGCVRPSGNKNKVELVATGHNVTNLSEEAELVEVGNLSFYVLKDTKVPVYTTSTKLNMNVCDSSNTDRQITYSSDQIATVAGLPDGENYQPGDLKPAWKQLSADLGVQFANTATGLSSDAQITENVRTNKLNDSHIVTGSGNAITTNSQYFLDINQYLEYMPNYKAFLDENPIVKWSLTTNMETGAMYYAPYFDGNNDIEKYVLTHREWTRAILDGASVSAATRTWAESKTGKSDVGANQTYATGYMGTDGSYTVDTTDPNEPSKLTKLVVNYKAALDAVKSESAELGKAYKDAAGAAYTGTSGNIVDIMNAAIAAKSGAVTGAQLSGILRAYIDVAYQTESGAKFYTKRSDVFNSVSAGWDIDLYTALCRCVVTSNGLFGQGYSSLPANQLYAVAGRVGTTQRRTDLISFVGELYGVRGLESRNENAYVDANGVLQDARLNAETYDAMDKFSALSKEGLVYTGNESTETKYVKNTNTIITFSMHDYAQTQTTDGFYLDVEGFNGSTSAPNGLITEGDLAFDFAPIVTPVAKWDTDSNGSHETIMRFTESWRGVKNTGFCVPLGAVQGKPQELSAVLAFIDYLFSNDGQIVATYGTMDTTNNSENATGYWYGKDGVALLDDNGEVKSSYADIVESHDGIQLVVKPAYKNTYFSYGNVLYRGTDYLGTQVPILTDNNLKYFYGLEVNGNKMNEVNKDKTEGFKSAYAGKYTDYCRGVIGGALPIGNKSQGFEYQCTASCGLNGAAIVSKAILSGAIKHPTQEVSASTYWYTLVPTTLPIDLTDSNTIKNQNKISGADNNGGLFMNSGKDKFRTNMLIDVMFYGYGASPANGLASDKTSFGSVIPADAAACIALANTHGMNTRAGIYAKGWNQLKAAFMK